MHSPIRHVPPQRRVFGVVVVGVLGVGCGPKTSTPNGVAYPPVDDGSSVVASESAPNPTAFEPASASSVTDDSSGEETASGPDAVPADRLRSIDDVASVDWNGLIGRRVRLNGTWTVVDTFDLARRGRFKVARERLFVPTALIDPNDDDPAGTASAGGRFVARVQEAQKANDTATVYLDDGSTDQDVFPPRLVPGLGDSVATVRIGATVRDVVGTVQRLDRQIAIIPDGPVTLADNDRPPKPELSDADLTVASFNVLNYFTTLDDGRNNARGADNEAELERQRAKTVAAIRALDADVIGLMEIENRPEAERDLVDSLNAAEGSEVYAGCGVPDAFEKTAGGGDAIRVGFLYRSDRVETVGPPEAIDSRFFVIARTPIVQTFRPVDGGRPVTVIVNHFKSKGGSSEADAANKDRGDGQGNYNAARRAQAIEVAEYVERRRGDDPGARVLVIGDLNAYQQEDPIDALRASGLVDLHEQHSDGDTPNYSFVYYGQSGSLDHAFASPALAEDVTGVVTWHINADEPRFNDYNTEYNPPAMFREDPFRSSDHDPVLIGIRG